MSKEELMAQIGEIYEEQGLDNPLAQKLIRELESLPNPFQIHQELAKKYGRYDRFDELMGEYGHAAMALDFNSAIDAICKFQNDMCARNLSHYFPIINALNERLTDLAMKTAGGRVGK